MDIVSVFVGLDYHSDSIRVCVMTQEGETLDNRSVPNSVGYVIEAVQNVASAVHVKGVALEACTGSAEFASQLTAATEWTVRLAHAAAVHRLKQGPDKTDHTDAWHLANLLRVSYLPEVWLADAQTRQLRHLVRYRQSLMADAKDIKLRIRSLLKEDCVSETCRQQAWTKGWLEWLRTAELPEHSRWIIDAQLDLLKTLEGKLTEADRWMEAITKDDFSRGGNRRRSNPADRRMEAITKDDPVVQKLLEQPSVGLVTALLLRAVIGRFDRFRNGKQLARYCGVTPCNASSGKRMADSGLVEAGHDDLRVALIQLAKRLPRHEPHWQEFKARLGVRKPANVVSAAIANRWIRRLYHEVVPQRRAIETAAVA